MLSDADHGPGWTRDQGQRGDPVDPESGQPRADHSTIPERYLPPAAENIPAEVRYLVGDPEAPFGRDTAGQPYTRSEYEARYTNPDGTPRYPGNDGAVDGRRIDYTDMDSFRADYGDVVDRMGGPNGAFHSTPETPFEHRALPGSSLDAPYHQMRVADELPPGTRIEVSEIAPAFGQPGGGIQVRFLDETGAPMSMREARERGILERESTPGTGSEPGPEPGASDDPPDAVSESNSPSQARDPDDGPRDGDASNHAEGTPLAEEGARRRPRNPLDSVAQEQWAREVYDEILTDPQAASGMADNLSDVQRAGGRVGFSHEEIDQVVRHVMAEEHWLNDYAGGLFRGRFDPSEEMAEAFQRIRTGDAQPSDILLLEHEVTEAAYMRANVGASYAEAHAHANAHFDWEHRGKD